MVWTLTGTAMGDAMRLDTGMGLTVLGLCCAAVIIIGIFTSYPLPEGTTPINLLLGNQGLLPIAINAATFVAGIITVVLLFRRAKHDREQLEHARDTARITLFKDAAVLLSQPSEVASINGINIFADLARAFPLAFLLHVANGLTAFAADRTRSEWAEHLETWRGERQGQPAKPRTPLSVWNAYGALGSLRLSRGQPWPSFMNGGRYEFGWAYLGHGNIRHCNYSFCDLRSLFVHELAWVNVDFTETHAELFVSGQIEFRNCTFSHTTLAIRDLSNRLIGTTGFDARILLVGCTINEESFAGGIELTADMQIGAGVPGSTNPTTSSNIDTK